MKTLLKISTIVLLLINYSCNAQMVQTTNDVYLLKINEQQFINKPLKDLLKEIKPEIKTGDASIDSTYFFRFKFITYEQQRTNKGNREDRVSLYVYVKEPIDWKWEKRQKGNELLWTKEDFEKYGNIIVVKIKVINQPKE